MLFVSNSQTPGTREIPSAHLIITEQAVPIRTLYLQGMFLPKPEAAGEQRPVGCSGPGALEATGIGFEVCVTLNDST